jgi:hypothetical protein
MTPSAVRRIALSLPDAVEGAHMRHADFRLNGKVFAALGWPDKAWAMVKLPPELQDVLVRGAPDAFKPANGAWGRQGSIMVHLAAADKAMLKDAIRSAWQRLAAVKSKRLVKRRV